VTVTVTEDLQRWTLALEEAEGTFLKATLCRSKEAEQERHQEESETTQECGADFEDEDPMIALEHVVYELTTIHFKRL